MTIARQIRILSVDDHPLMREGIAALLANEPDIALVGEAENGREAIDKHRAMRPDLTLMDLRMPVVGGIEAIKAIRNEFPGAKIIVLTTYAADVLAKNAMRAGAQAYLLKSAVRKELVDTIRAVHAGQIRVAAEVASLMASRISEEELSNREIEVLQEIAAGSSNKVVASRLGLAEETVKGYVKSILSKLSANDRTHAVALGTKRGIIEL